ncbi:glycosyltransferase family 39 protein [uncultured Microbacterium sp.]|uniref:glycosyltransferase family 39 protein n=1 Tax=uncultured Microbacterium sp. TaxID=191216 RepID=UPI0025DF0FDB|nr:glycosyltransferase family 39 protein [uncultured Microbacterium sp.]
MTPAPALARWWREPWWARVSLALIVGGFVVLTCWNLSRGGDFSFYEAAARSMSQSWRALFFGAFDPAATVTLDKLSGFAVPQALSIRLFGMSISAIALPQVVEGTITVLACAVIGLRWGGRGAGLVAAAAAASTPIFVSMFAHPMEDGLLTMSLAVAVVWWQRAMLTSRWWSLLVAALFVGLGFQAKMMAAWFVLPALIVATLFAIPDRRRALARAGAVTGVSVAVSVAWMTVFAAIPAGSRPYVDGSTDDDIFAMVFGYNGLNRLAPGAYPGSVGSSGGPGGVAATLASIVHALSTPASSSSHGSLPTLSKLVELPLVTQIGWLYPAALAGIVLGLWRYGRRRGRPASTARRLRFALVAAAAVWLVTAAVVLTFTRVPHTAYVASLGVPMVLLTAIAWREGLRLLRARHLVPRLVLPAVVIVQAAWWAWLIARALLPAVLLIPAMVIGAAGLLIGLVAALRGRSAPRPVRRAAPFALAVALLCLPVATSLQVLDAARDGSGGDAYVGTTAVGGNRDEVFTVSSPAPWGGHPSLTPALAQLVAEAGRHGGGADGTPLFVTDSWSISAQVIDVTGASVLTDGGYSGHVPVFTADQLTAMVKAGRVHLFAVASGAPEGDPVREVATGPGCSALTTATISPAKEAADGRPASKATDVTLYECR